MADGWQAPPPPYEVAVNQGSRPAGVPTAPPPAYNPASKIPSSIPIAQAAPYGNVPTSVPMAAAGPPPPYAQPSNYNQGPGYNQSPGMNYNQGLQGGYNQPPYNDPPAFANNMGGGGHPVTVREDYVGPVTICISCGLLLFFWPAMCLPFCCPCDTRTTTYLDGRIVAQSG